MRLHVAAIVTALLVTWALPADAASALIPASGAAPVQTSACADAVGPSLPPPSTPPTGLPGYHAAWYGQSGYPTLCPGHTAVATIALMNTGSLGWYAGVPGATAYLGTWGPDPGQDRASILGGPTIGWPSGNRVAVQPAAYVGPGEIAWFQFTVKAPDLPGVYVLGLRPLIEGAQWMEDYGVFWTVTVKAAADGGSAQQPATPSSATTSVARTYYPSTAADGTKSVRVNVLMYHHVEWLPPNADALRKDLTVSPTDFAAQLQYLKANGYHAITTVDLWWALDQGGALPAKPVLLSFDDGYADAHDVVLPLLEQYGMVGTFAVTANLVGRPDYMTIDEVRDLADSGMDVESHSTDHVAVNRLPYASQVYQLCTSRQILKQWTGKDVRTFIYPSGDHLPTPSAALAACGYLTAYRKDGGSTQSSAEMYGLRRARVHGEQGLMALLVALQQ
ncbi:MAG: polysaccharide deacetylase family protein [Chloroflexota bacterium]|nr:polysaccharide deacetylase family protein [Chloroflexota bacterium]